MFLKLARKTHEKDDFIIYCKHIQEINMVHFLLTLNKCLASSQLAFTCSKSSMKTPEQYVRLGQS